MNYLLAFAWFYLLYRVMVRIVGLKRTVGSSARQRGLKLNSKATNRAEPAVRSKPPKIKSWDDAKKELLKDPGIRREYEKLNKPKSKLPELEYEDRPAKSYKQRRDIQ